MGAVDAMLIGLGTYALAGAAFAPAFLALGIARVDPAARGTRWAVRALLAPGVIALWPVMAARWARARSSRGGGP